MHVENLVTLSLEKEERNKLLKKFFRHKRFFVVEKLCLFKSPLLEGTCCTNLPPGRLEIYR
jgi:hypothetical protein